MSQDEQWSGAFWLEGPSVLEAVSRYRWVVLTLVVLGAAAGYAYASLQTPVYEASARLLLADPQSAGLSSGLTAPQIDRERYVRNQEALIESGPVFWEAATDLDDVAPGQLAGHIEVFAEDDIDMLTIVARDASPERAAVMANAVGETYQDVVTRAKQESAQKAIDELEARNDRLRERIADSDDGDEDSGARQAAQADREAAITQLVNNENRIQQLAVEAELFGSGVQNFAPAGVPGAPISSSPLRPAAIGFVLGAALGAGLAYRMDMTRGVDSGEEAGRILGVPLLGELPEMPGSRERGGMVPTLSAPLSVEAEAYHYVAAALELSLPKLTGTTVLVTSVGPGEGKTITALNLALALGRDGTPVLLVDADERQRGLSRFVDTGAKPGLRELIRGDMPIEECVQDYRVRDGIGLQVIAAPLQVMDPAAFYRTRGMGRALERLKQTGQLVLIDSPPLSVSETSTMAGQSDAVMLLVSRGTSPRDLRRALHRLDLVGASVCGFVFNRAKVEGPRVIYGRSHGASTRRARTVRDAAATASSDGGASESSRDDRVLSSGAWSTKSEG